MSKINKGHDNNWADVGIWQTAGQNDQFLQCVARPKVFANITHQYISEQQGFSLKFAEGCGATARDSNNAPMTCVSNSETDNTLAKLGYVSKILVL
ncbi:hypothetical protein BaRGS_00025686 [Batillaria attramentaria]|uniref:Uncharacterized protein n=1 Tax=Batillaria attramentaria TaxID=370345 RepID=A0ABD0K7N9_9CAEN